MEIRGETREETRKRLTAEARARIATETPEQKAANEAARKQAEELWACQCRLSVEPDFDGFTY